MKRLVLPIMFALSLVIVSQSARADDLGDAFNYLVSHTDAGSYNSQVKGYVTGGALNVSFPSGSVTLISITPPDYEAGCGGISMFLGGLAYISGSEFTAMLKNIATAALGYAFNLALRTLCPVCSTILADLQKAAQLASELAMNQCRISMGLVNKIADQTGLNRYIQGAAAQSDAHDGKGGSSFLSDFEDYGNDIAKGWGKIQSFIDGLQSDLAKQQESAKQPVGNTVWKALPDTGAVQRIFIQSLIGTIFVSPPKDGKKGYVQPLTPSITAPQLSNMFVFGAKATVNQNLKLTECADASINVVANPTINQQCHPVKHKVLDSYWYQKTKVSDIGGVSLGDYGFFGATYALLMQASANNAQDVALGNAVTVPLPDSIYGASIKVTAHFTKEQITAFLSTAPIPLYQAVNMASWNQSASEVLLQSISELVSAQYTLAYIQHSILDTSLVGNNQVGTIGGNPVIFHQIRDALQNINKQITQISASVIQNFQIEQSWTSELHNLQKMMYQQSIKSGMAGNFAFAASMQGAGN